MNNQLVKIALAAVSDRGLSEKRPLNEDSYLADADRRIFAVADGVGGAQAGEVASQTAVEVLNEAFLHQDPSADVEDLMELAIQRANSSINRMAQEHPKLQMMATTIVALHLNEHVATIGHVGDSRLYRVTPDGELHRETRDHSVVEEEVRAGRMTPAQAAHHPSRNVISRALGAEEGVEVDMKTLEVADGTTFLLCSDGITRHIPDDELRGLLNTSDAPDSICGEMKRLCFERGAEDNLTAVIVRVGEGAADGFDGQKTMQHPAHALAATMSGEHQADGPSMHETIDAVRPLSPTPAAQVEDADRTLDHAPPVSTIEEAPKNIVVAEPYRRSAFASFVRVVFFLILLAGVGVGAFFGGMYIQRRNAQLEAEQAAANPTPPHVAQVSSIDHKRNEIDKAPAQMAEQMAKEQGDTPLASSDPEFLNLYGRALLLSGKYAAASVALKRASEFLKDRPNRDPLKVETRMLAALAALKSGNAIERDKASTAMDEVIERDEGTLPAGQKKDNSKRSATRRPEGSFSSPVELPR